MDEVVWLVLVGLLSIGPLTAVTLVVAWLSWYTSWRMRE
jgi:hypothetical protein